MFKNKIKYLIISFLQALFTVLGRPLTFVAKKFASSSVGFLSIEPIITLPKDYSLLSSYDVFSPLVTVRCSISSVQSFFMISDRKSKHSFLYLPLSLNVPISLYSTILLFIIFIIWYYAEIITFISKYRDHAYFFISLIPLCILSGLTFVFPRILLIFSLFLGILSFSFNFNIRLDVKYTTEDFNFYVFQFLEKTLILSYFSMLFKFIFYRTYLSLIQLTLLINAFCLLYACLIRYYFYNTFILHKGFSISILLVFYFCFLIGLIFLYIRLLVAISIILTYHGIQRGFLNPNILLIEDIDPKSTDNTNKNNYSLYSKHTHNHHHHNVPQNVAFWKKTGFWASMVTLGLSSAIVYYTKGAYDAMVIANVILERQTDIAEVDAGVRTKESYNQKWPQNKIHSDENISADLVKKHFPEIPTKE